MSLFRYHNSISPNFYSLMKFHLFIRCQYHPPLRTYSTSGSVELARADPRARNSMRLHPESDLPSLSSLFSVPNLSSFCKFCESVRKPSQVICISRIGRAAVVVADISVVVVDALLASQQAVLGARVYGQQDHYHDDHHDHRR